MAESSNAACKICSGVFEKNNPEVKVGKKGLTTLLNAIKARREKDMEDYFKTKLDEGNAVVHMECRKRYIDLRKIETTAQPEVKRSRSSVGKFDWREDCLFCGEQCVTQSSSKHPRQQNFAVEWKLWNSEINPENYK